MESVSRRSFMGAAAVGGLQAGMVSDPSDDIAASDTADAVDIQRLVNEIPFVDTHEHFHEESLRLRAARGEDRSVPAPDFGMLLSHYTDSDLQVSGMPPEDYARVLRYDVPVEEKWRLVEPYYERCRNTGYQRSVRETLRSLYGVEDLNADTVAEVSRLLAEQVQPGFYARLLREKANIEYAQVNCLKEPVFRETEMPDLLAVDLSINHLCVPPNLQTLGKYLTKDVKTLADARAAIDAVFARYAPQAIAVKSQCAYWRPLDFPMVSEGDAEPLFRRYVDDRYALRPEETADLEGHLFHYCIEQCVAYRLPVKLHTGYFAGHNRMPLQRVRDNAGYLCPVFQAHPEALFVLFHIDYPYQDAAIALAKHYSNVYLDMCWTWIINPTACVRFLKEFLMAAPAHKLTAFGGDYAPVELAVGHAAVARQGIVQALTELCREGWIEARDAPMIARRIMCDNAHNMYNHDRTRKNARR